MLRWRLILSVLFIAAFVAVFWLDLMVTRPGAFLLPGALLFGLVAVGGLLGMRSGERRVGEEGRSLWAPYHLKKKK